MRIAFLGTPDFAVPSLKALYAMGHDIACFTQPDRKKGRGGKVAMPEVKEAALSLSLPVYQFEKISCDEGVAKLREFSPELMVTAAFGQILTEEILNIPKHGCVNVHASLLPKYRGASPIQQAVLNGDKVTGVTTMLTDIGLDTGDILLARETEIGLDETAGELFDRLAVLGAQVLTETVRLIETGNIIPVKQDASKATKCRTIKKEQGRIDFNDSAEHIHNLVRGMNPWPTAFALWQGNIIKIHKTKVRQDVAYDAAPGTCFIASPKQGLFVATGDGALEILQLQMSGSRAMTAREFLNSKKLLNEVLS